MDEAAHCADDSKSEAETGHALVMLDMVWGDQYRFGYDPEHGFWATPHGKMKLFTAPTPEELGGQLAAEAGTPS